MKIYDNVYQHVVLQLPAEAFKGLLEKIRDDKENEMTLLKHKIQKYEEKRRTEAALYQSMSPIRKFFSSRPPSHHQAVEYLVHVKERLKKIAIIKQQLLEINRLLEQETAQECLELPSPFIHELLAYHEQLGDQI
ncbi:hypothetical protein JOD43_003027 [Pullulanibacillus pueri]|uniref:Uncharacterized protein n=1 Tax=Pullulanibacillus pueri TaxID=1437324 RepID=A0A8J2ZWV4_9BACL|nr:hypothetical protein [Pullulanibacillus pueri]MBM7682848.1 hypothetical protein [Pullulanibacillus pueri]GGH84278.1 hypothetical protein GCM10007096_26980 [Pullulanibacillus pueri]